MMSHFIHGNLRGYYANLKDKGLKEGKNVRSILRQHFLYFYSVSTTLNINGSDRTYKGTVDPYMGRALGEGTMSVGKSEDWLCKATFLDSKVHGVGKQRNR